MKKILLLIVLIIIVLLLLYRNKITAVVSVEQPTSQILKGTFRDTKNDKIFDYSDPNGYLYNCQQINCKFVYFDTDFSGNVNQILEVSSTPVFGTITDIKYIDNEHVQYIFDYQKDGKTYHVPYVADLCSYFKGGSKQCHTIAQKDQVASLKFYKNKDEVIEQIVLFNNLLKADVLKIVPVNH